MAALGSESRQANVTMSTQVPSERNQREKRARRTNRGSGGKAQVLNHWEAVVGQAVAVL